MPPPPVPASAAVAPTQCKGRLRTALLVMAAAAALALVVGALYWRQRAGSDAAAEGYTTFSTAVITSEALEKSRAYNNAGLKTFYSAHTAAGVADALTDEQRAELVFFYFTILDTLCTATDRAIIDSVSSQLCEGYPINTLTRPTDLPSQVVSTPCSSVEATQPPASESAPRVRVLSHDYDFAKSCLRLPNITVTQPNPNAPNRLKLTMQLGDAGTSDGNLARESAVRVVLLRPQFVTCSMSYLYAVSYIASDYAADADNSMVNFNSDTATRLVMCLDRVTDPKIYMDDSLFSLKEVTASLVSEAAVNCNDTRLDGPLTSGFALRQAAATHLTLTFYYLVLRSRVNAVIPRSHAASLLFRNVQTTTNSALFSFTNTLNTPGSFGRLNIAFSSSSRELALSLNGTTKASVAVPSGVPAFDAIVVLSTDMAVLYASWPSSSGRRMVQKTAFLSTSSFVNVSVDAFDGAAGAQNCALGLPEAGNTTCVVPSMLHAVRALGI